MLTPLPSSLILYSFVGITSLSIFTILFTIGDRIVGNMPTNSKNHIDLIFGMRWHDMIISTICNHPVGRMQIETNLHCRFQDNSRRFSFDIFLQWLTETLNFLNRKLSSFRITSSLHTTFVLQPWLLRMEASPPINVRSIKINSSK